MSDPNSPRQGPKSSQTHGLTCPRCGCVELRVLNTRPRQGRIVRYRQCRKCRRRLTTYEVMPSKLVDPRSARNG